MPSHAKEDDALLLPVSGSEPPSSSQDVDAVPRESWLSRLVSVIAEFLPMAFVAFGGPPAHLGLMHDRFVVTKQWLSNERFLEVMSIAQVTPGPLSTKVVAAIAIFRAGPLGGVAALVCWVLPAFIGMTLAGIGAKTYLQGGFPEWMKGLAAAAVALVVIASVRLWQKAVGDHKVKALVATIAACVVLTMEGASSLLFPSTMLAGGLLVLVLHLTGVSKVEVKANPASNRDIQKQIGISPLGGALILFVWFAVLISLAIFHPQTGGQHSLLALFYTLYWVGSIVFGGGHVMLPILLDLFVREAWVTKEQFLAGFALMQALPGPIYSISAYLGAVLFGPVGAVVGAVAIFTPGLTLFLGILPLWERVRENAKLQVFLAGVNAAACGFVVASIFLLWEKAVHSNGSAAAAIAAGIAVGVFHVPSPLAIVVGALVGYLLSPGLLNVGQQDYCHP